MSKHSKPGKGPKPHTWKPLARMPWPWCPSCGLLRLHNEATDTAARKPCPGDDE